MIKKVFNWKELIIKAYILSVLKTFVGKMMFLKIVSDQVTLRQLKVMMKLVSKLMNSPQVKKSRVNWQERIDMIKSFKCRSKIIMNFIENITIEHDSLQMTNFEYKPLLNAIKNQIGKYAYLDGEVQTLKMLITETDSVKTFISLKKIGDKYKIVISDHMKQMKGYQNMSVTFHKDRMYFTSSESYGVSSYKYQGRPISGGLCHIPKIAYPIFEEVFSYFGIERKYAHITSGNIFDYLYYPYVDKNILGAFSTAYESGLRFPCYNPEYRDLFKPALSLDPTDPGFMKKFWEVLKIPKILRSESEKYIEAYLKIKNKVDDTINLRIVLLIKLLNDKMSWRRAIHAYDDDIDFCLNYIVPKRNFKDVEKMISSNPDCISDCMGLYSSIKAHMNPGRFIMFNREIVNIQLRDLHDFLVRKSMDLKDVKKRLFIYDKKSVFKGLKEVDLKDGYTIKIPRTQKDLIYLGDSLSICVGHVDAYGTNIQYKEIYILPVYKNNAPYGCVEYNRKNGHIVQSRLKYNAEMSSDSICYNKIKNVCEKIYQKEVK